MSCETDRSTSGSQQSAGHLVMVVGPSGAGKDTLIGAAMAVLSAHERSHIHVARRVVTRPAGPFEDHDSLTPDAYERRLQAGDFGLAWRAHGLSYGITREELLRPGQVVVANVSRTVVAVGCRLAPVASVVLITASRPVLAGRIAGRGRQGDDADRLERLYLDDAVRPGAALVIDNDGAPEPAGACLAAYLEWCVAGVCDRN